MKSVMKYKFSFVFLLIILFSTNGCTVQYVADYDAAIKEEIVKTAKNVDIFWGRLLDTESSERDYDKFKEQYNEIEGDIRSLVMRNEIRTFNDESTKQAGIALDLWVEDRELHKKNDGFSDFEGNRHRKQFNRVFTAMATGEDVKDI